MCATTWQTLNRTFDLGSGYYGGYFSDAPLTEIDEKYIGSVIDYDTLTKISRQLTVSMGSMMGLVNGFAIMIFVVIVYLLSKMIIEKNAQSISMTKILGYSGREIARLYLLSTTVVVVLCLAVSLPIEVSIMRELFHAIILESMTGWISLGRADTVPAHDGGGTDQLRGCGYSGISPDLPCSDGRGAEKCGVMLSELLMQSMPDGFAQLLAGLDQLAQGADTYMKAVGQVSQGASTLADGTAQLNDASAGLYSGLTELHDGAAALRDGVQEFSKKAGKELGDDFGDGLQNVVRRLKAVQQAGKAYQTFTGLADGMTGNVKFIVETAEIK